MATIDETARDDLLVGTDGDDTFTLTRGSDLVQAGGGDDTVTLLDPPDDRFAVIDGGAGVDLVRVPLHSANFTIQTSGDRVDLIGVYELNKRVLSITNVEWIAFDDATLSVAELVHLSALPTATRVGTAGDDAVELNGASPDNLILGAGNDSVSGFAFRGDWILAGDGNDEIGTSIDNARVYGEAGDDILHLMSSQAMIDGGAGDDRLIYRLRSSSSGDQATVRGGAGEDTFIVADPDDLSVRAVSGEGLVFAGRNGTTVLVTPDVERFEIGEETLTYAEVAVRAGAAITVKRGTDEADTLIADTGVLRLEGLAGNDSLEGRSGDGVILDGGAGNDSLLGYGDAFGGDGNDRIETEGFGLVVDGGDGNDTLIHEERGLATLNGGAGDDDITNNARRFNPNPFATAESRGGAGNDTIVSTGLVSGGDGDDSITATGAYGRLFGDAGNDTLIANDETELADGGAGDDRIEGPAATVIGGEGKDTLVLETPERLLVEEVNGGLLLSRPGYDPLIQVLIDPSVEVIEIGDITLSYADFAAAYAGRTGDDLIEGGRLILAGPGNDTLVADAGGSELRGDEGNDLLRGGAGNDTLLGQDGDDTVRAGAGDDSVYDRYGRNEIFGEAGNDTLISDAYRGDLVDGGSGDDSITGRDGSTLRGGDGKDTLEGGEATLEGGAGDDLLQSARGDALLLGGSGDDTLSGGFGNSLHGGAGDDLAIVALTYTDDRVVRRQVEGGIALGYSYSDVIFVADDIEIIQDRSGRRLSYDALFASATPVPTGAALTGTPEADGLTGEEGRDTIVGLAGADVLIGNAGNDDIRGGKGDDNISGGDGDDTLTGADGHDILRGDAGDDLLSGGNGDDMLTTGDGFDTIAGGAGLDVVQVFALPTAALVPAVVFADQIVQFLPTGMAVMDADVEVLKMAGVRRALSEIRDRGPEVGAILVEAADGMIRGGAGADALWTATAGATLSGGDGADLLVDYGGGQLVGGAGKDTLVGYEHSSHLDGGRGDDWLIKVAYDYDGLAGMRGGPGNDTLEGEGLMDGGRGDDVYRLGNLPGEYYHGATILEVPGGGYDVVLLPSDNYESAIFDASRIPVEEIRAGGTGDWRIIGNGLDNLLRGNAGDNLIVAGKGNDRLLGHLGDDTFVLSGPGDVIVEGADAGYDTARVAFSWSMDAHVDRLVGTGTGNMKLIGNGIDNHIIGTEGNNVLTGRGGQDTLEGGLGADRFVFDRKPTEFDVIVDFEAEDSLVLASGAFEGMTRGVLDPAQFFAGDIAEAGDARFVLDDRTLWFVGQSTTERVAVFGLASDLAAIGASDIVIA